VITAAPHLPIGYAFSRWAARIGFLAMLGTGVLDATAQHAHFDILKGDRVVGKIVASKTATGERTIYVMSSYSEFDLVWKRVVRSVMTTEYLHGELRSCNNHMHMNDALRDSSSMRYVNKTHACYVHPGQHFVHEGSVKWTTARMYYEEPVGQKSIFVESVLKHCPLVRTGNGTYSLTMPEDKVNHYIYKDGRLHEIRVDRTFFELVFRRT
jgi:hypothetical protein